MVGNTFMKRASDHCAFHLTGECQMSLIPVQCHYQKTKKGHDNDKHLK